MNLYVHNLPAILNPEMSSYDGRFATDAMRVFYVGNEVPGHCSEATYIFYFIFIFIFLFLFLFIFIYLFIYLFLFLFFIFLIFFFLLCQHFRF